MIRTKNTKNNKDYTMKTGWSAKWTKQQISYGFNSMKIHNDYSIIYLNLLQISDLFLFNFFFGSIYIIYGSVLIEGFMDQQLKSRWAFSDCCYLRLCYSTPSSKSRPQQYWSPCGWALWLLDCAIAFLPFMNNMLHFHIFHRENCVTFL